MPNYGEVYANKKYFSNNYIERKKAMEEHPMLLSYLLLGKVFPVIEHPTNCFPNYHAMPCKDGYDSHYTIVNSKGFPCKLLDGEEPTADEIVVFNTNQVST